MCFKFHRTSCKFYKFTQVADDENLPGNAFSLVQSSNVTWGRIKRDFMVTVESLKNKIIDKNNGNVDDLNDWERILKRRVIIGLGLCKILIPWNSLDMV